jgi:hypothetical protein
VKYFFSAAFVWTDLKLKQYKGREIPWGNIKPNNADLHPEAFVHL